MLRPHTARRRRASNCASGNSANTTSRLRPRDADAIALRPITLSQSTTCTCATGCLARGPGRSTLRHTPQTLPDGAHVGAEAVDRGAHPLRVRVPCRDRRRGQPRLRGLVRPEPVHQVDQLLQGASACATPPPGGVVGRAARYHVGWRRAASTAASPRLHAYTWSLTADGNCIKGPKAAGRPPLSTAHLHAGDGSRTWDVRMPSGWV